MSATGLEQRPSLWHHHDFRLFWQGSTVSVFGSAVSRLALPLVATVSLDASPFAIGLLVAASELPLLIFGLFAGVWVDRRVRLPIMIRCDIARALLLLTIPAAWWLDWLSMPLLVAVALIAGSLSVFFEIAAQSMVATLLEPADFVQGNSLRYAGESGAAVVGLGVTGFLVQISGAAGALLIDAGTYAYSALCLRRMRFREPAPASGSHSPILPAVIEGLRYVWHTVALRVVTLASGLLTFFYAFIFAMSIPFATRTLGLPASVVGIALAASGIGSVIGSAFPNRLVRRIGLGPTLVLGLAATLPGLLIAALAGGSEFRATVMFIGGVFAAALMSPMWDINQFSLRQAVTPNRLRGRVNASTRVVIRGAPAIGAIVAGLVANELGLRTAMLIGALSPLPALTLVATSSVRGLRTMPEPPAD